MGNSAHTYGGGVFVDQGTTTVRNSTFSGNTALPDWTGGAWMSGASLVLENDPHTGQNFNQVP